MGELSPNISMSSKGGKKEKESDEESQSSNSEDSDVADIKKEPKIHPEKYANLKNEMTESSKAIMKFWVIRARLKQKVRTQVTRVIDANIDEECIFCRTHFGLRVELIQNIEDMFFMFLRETKANFLRYKPHRWVQWFEEHAAFRTVCLECAEEIERYHDRLRRQALKKERKQQFYSESEPEDSVDRDKRVSKIRSVSDGARAIILKWIGKARERLRLKAELEMEKDLNDVSP